MEKTEAQDQRETLGTKTPEKEKQIPQQGPKNTGTQELGRQFLKITRSLGQYKAAILQCPHKTALTVLQSLLGRGQLLLLLIHLLRAYIVHAHLIMSELQAKYGKTKL